MKSFWRECFAVLSACLISSAVIAGGIYNPPAGGSGSGTVTSFSCVTANGVSCSVANPTTTPAATFTLGAINPSSIGATTSGSATFTTISTANASLGGTTTANNLTVTGTCTGCGGGGSPSTPAQSLQYDNAGSFGGATGLYYSTTRSGLDFLASVTTANLISLGNNGADVTSYALGESALLAQSTTNRQNTAIGGFALTALTTGTQNTALGWDSGQVITTGSNNTIIGALVASTTLTTGSKNILIGSGSAIDTLTATTTGFLNIGNTIFATGVNGGTLASPSGQVGIGTTSPTAFLDIEETSASAITGLKVVTTGAGGSGGTVASFTNTLFPAYALAAYGQVYIGGSTYGGGIYFDATTVGSGGKEYEMIASNGTNGLGAGKWVLYDNTAGHALITTTSAGLVDIGTNTAPSDRLDVDGGIGLTTTTATIPTNGIYSSVANTLILTTSGAQSGLINSTGNDNTAFGFKALNAVTTGINNTALGYAAGALITTGTGNIAVGNNAGGVLTVGNNNIYIGNSINATTTADAGVINFDGVWTVTGATTPSTAIGTMNGSLNTTATLSTASTLKQGTELSCSTGLTTDGSGNINGCVASDRSLKTGVQALQYNPDLIDKLHPISYLWKDPSRYDKKRHGGFIAQEIEILDPLAVKPAGKDLLGIDNSALEGDIVLDLQNLHKVVKAQQKEIDDLKKQVAKKK